MWRSVAAAVSVLFVSAAVAQDQPGQPARVSAVPTLSVSGEGKVFVAPDVAVVRLGAFAQHKDAEAAQAQVNEVMQKVVAAIRGVEVPQEEIQTSGLSLRPVTRYRQPRPGEDASPEPEVVGYRADMSVSVRLRDTKRAGPVIDAGLTAGANTLHGISFELLDEEKATGEALRKAVQTARAKATALSGALGVELTQLMEVVEGGAQIIQPMYEMSVAADAMRSAMPGTPIEAGQVQVTANVTLRYRMGGAGAGRPPAEGGGGGR